MLLFLSLSILLTVYPFASIFVNQSIALNVYPCFFLFTSVLFSTFLCHRVSVALAPYPRPLSLCFSLCLYYPVCRSSPPMSYFVPFSVRGSLPLYLLYSLFISRCFILYLYVLVYRSAYDLISLPLAY